MAKANGYADQRNAFDDFISFRKKTNRNDFVDPNCLFCFLTSLSLRCRTYIQGLHDRKKIMKSIISRYFLTLIMMYVPHGDLCVLAFVRSLLDFDANRFCDRASYQREPIWRADRTTKVEKKKKRKKSFELENHRNQSSATPLLCHLLSIGSMSTSLSTAAAASCYT